MIVTLGFDSGKSCPYHGSIMPHTLYAWYSPHELEALGQRKVQLNGEIGATRLTRLREILNSDEGSVRASLKFGQQGGGYVTVDLHYETNFELACQRCLEPMKEKASGHVLFVVLEDESMAAGAPAGYEPIMLSGGRFQPAEVIEDELLVSLPLIPRHARIEECGRLTRNLEILKDDNEARPVDPSLRSH
jgi:uncharacterized protein